MTLEQIRLQQAELRLELLRHRYERMRGLVVNHYVSVEDFEQAEFDFQNQQLEVLALKLPPT